MKKATSFGVRGMTAEERAAANPYLAVKVPLGGNISSNSAYGVDENLRRFMLGVYNYMFIGLLLTGIVAFLTYNLTVTTDPQLAAMDAEGLVLQISETGYLTSLGMWLWATEIRYVVCFGPILLLLFTASAFRGAKPTAATVT